MRVSVVASGASPAPALGAAAKAKRVRAVTPKAAALLSGDGGGDGAAWDMPPAPARTPGVKIRFSGGVGSGGAKEKAGSELTCSLALCYSLCCSLSFVSIPPRFRSSRHVLFRSLPFSLNRFFVMPFPAPDSTSHSHARALPFSLGRLCCLYSDYRVLGADVRPRAPFLVPCRNRWSPLLTAAL